jgi:hypothetical protein
LGNYSTFGSNFCFAVIPHTSTFGWVKEKVKHLRTNQVHVP